MCVKIGMQLNNVKHANNCIHSLGGLNASCVKLCGHTQYQIYSINDKCSNHLLPTIVCNVYTIITMAGLLNSSW